MMVGTNITLSFVSSFRAPRCLALSDAIVLLTAIFHASVHPTVILHTPASHFPRETSLIDTIICIIFLGDVQASSKVHMASAQRPLMAHANVTRISLKLCIIFPTSPPHSAASAAISARRSTDVYFKDFQAETVAVIGAGGGIWATMGTCGSC